MEWDSTKEQKSSLGHRAVSEGWGMEGSREGRRKGFAVLQVALSADCSLAKNALVHKNSPEQPLVKGSTLSYSLIRSPQMQLSSEYGYYVERINIKSRKKKF